MQYITIHIQYNTLQKYKYNTNTMRIRYIYNKDTIQYKYIYKTIKTHKDSAKHDPCFPCKIILHRCESRIVYFCAVYLCILIADARTKSFMHEQIVS